MNLTHTEAIKEIKALEEKKALIIENEDNRNTFSYKEGEQIILPDYSYEQTRIEIAEIDSEVRKIKHALAKANCTVRLDGFDMSIGEGLIYLAQLSGEYDRLADMAEYQQKTREMTHTGVLEYTECMFNVKEVVKQKDALRRKINSLQVAIDKANLLSTIEI